MSAKPNDLYFYGSANLPEADGVTTGGAVDFTCKIAFNDITPNGLMDYVSSSASDTAATIAVTGRDATGVLVTETKTLNGTTLVNGSQTFERLMKGIAGGTTAVGDIAAIAHTATLSGRTAQTGSANSTGTTPPLMKLQAGDGAARALGEIIRITSGTGAGQIRQVVGLPASLGTDIVAVNRDWHGPRTTPASTRAPTACCSTCRRTRSPRCGGRSTTWPRTWPAARRGPSTRRSSCVNNNTATR
jgi:hypothetical protein